MRSLPRVVSSIPGDLRNFLDRVREYLGEGGDGRFVTLRELKKGGIVGTTPGGTIIPPGQEGVEDPSSPKNLVATGAFAVIFLEWDAPDYLGHSHTEVWSAATDDLTAATLIGTTEANSYGDEIGTGASKYYWVRFVNALGTVGAFNATAGTLGATSQDPDYLIDVLSDAYGVTGDAPFFQIDTPTTINGVLIPAGTYIKQAWIADATISRAKIQDLAVDNAKINDLNVNKLLAGALQVGSYIESQSYTPGTSGWRINSNGSAEFSNVTVRGTVASSTILGGSATNYSTGTGLFAGLDSGTYKFRVGNPSGNRLQWDGSALSIVGAITGSTVSGSTITVNTAALSGTTMTGSGAVFNSSGTFAIGNATTNITFNGTTITLNGSVVGTTNIASGGVSDTEFNSNGSDLDFSTTSELTVATTPTVVIPASSSAVLLSYSLAYYSDTSSAFSMTIRVYRDATLLKTTVVRLKASIDQVVSNIHVDDSPTSGSVTYKVTGQVTAGGTPAAGNLKILAGQGTIVATLLKR